MRKFNVYKQVIGKSPKGSHSVHKVWITLIKYICTLRKVMIIFAYSIQLNVYAIQIKEIKLSNINGSCNKKSECKG